MGGRQVLLYTRALPTRLAVKGALDLADLEPVISSNPVELLEKAKQGLWDAIILDAEGSPVPLDKLMSVIGAQAAATGAVVLAIKGETQRAPTEPEAFIYDRPLGRLPLLGALNRMLMAHGKKPIIRAPRPTAPNQRRALRVPMLVPVAFRSPERHTAWTDGEVLDISVGGAGLAELPGVTRGELLEVRNLLTREEAAFRVAWVLDEYDEVAGGMQANGELLRFWLPR